ncbi:hypothetical protein VYU27_008657 [Nannochloropsis oceanica]
MPIIELRQRSRGYVELGHDDGMGMGEEDDSFYHGAAAGDNVGRGLGLSDAPLGGGGISSSQYNDGSDDDFSTSGPQGPVGKWARFRKTSRERLLRGFSPLRRSISTTAHHPSAPRVYQFVFFYSLWAVCFLSPVAHMLLNESPYIHVKKGELDKRAMGWVVVEAVILFACLLLFSGYLWYRHARRKAMLGSLTYSRLGDGRGLLDFGGGGREGGRGIFRRSSYHDDPFLR